MTAITLLLANTTPVNPVGDGAAIDAGDFCACDFRCDFEELVFADNNGVGLTNDFTDFLFRKISASDTIEIQLYRYGNKVADIVDDTYGTFYSGFTEQPLYVGWLADWTKIFNAFSGGLYQVKVNTSILGTDSTFESRLFRLNIYDGRSANGTVKIESYQTGNIESSEFDFTNLIEGGWYSSIRLKGSFGEMEPSLERDIYLDDSYREVQNRDVLTRAYNLRCNIIPETIYNRLATNEMLANEVYVTSFDLLQEQTYEQLPVVPESFAENNYGAFGRLNFVVQFSDRQKNINKRNF